MTEATYEKTAAFAARYRMCEVIRLKDFTAMKGRNFLADMQAGQRI